MRHHPGGRRGRRGVLLVAALLLAPVSAGLVAVLPSTPASAAALPVASFTVTTADPTATLPVVLRRVAVERPRRHRLLHLELR